jgi:hypothetical protein
MYKTNVRRLRSAMYMGHSWLKAKPVLSAITLGFVLLLTTGFKNGPADGDNSATAHRTSKAAIEHFWAVYHGNDYDAIPQLERELQNAIQHDLGNPTLYALLGATHFWHFGEAARDTVPQDPVLAEDMPDAVDLFGKSLELDYYTKHLIGYVNDDHLPGYLGITTVHLGQQYRDPELIAKGDQLLDFSVYQFPEFNNFNRWAAHNTDPKDSDSYKKALDSLWQALDSCVGTTLDRTNPDLRPYLYLQTAVGRKKACWSEGDLAPHSFEGFMLNLGNGLLKAGQVEAARIMFANVKYADNYASWPYRSYFEQVASSDLYARAARYADSDSSNDPPLGVANRGCSYCHATVPEPGRPVH